MRNTSVNSLYKREIDMCRDHIFRNRRQVKEANFRFQVEFIVNTSSSISKYTGSNLQSQQSLARCKLRVLEKFS